CPLSTFVPCDNTTMKPYFEFDFSRLQDLSKRWDRSDALLIER
ncbi:hypothetical protein F444_20092, partial [Phytophthora nicotianae P1976]